MSTSGVSLAKARGKARRFAMQAIYQWQMTGDDIIDIKRQYMDDNEMGVEGNTIDSEYYIELVEGVHNNVLDIDPLLEKFMNRKILDVDPIERAIIRIATYEFLKRLDVPYKVIVNEAVNLSKKFCSEQSHAFVNAVLDKLAHEIRVHEVSAQSPN